MSPFLRALPGLLLVLPLLGLAKAAAAQERFAGSDPFAGIRAGERVRWTQTDAGRMEGRFEGRTGASIVVRTPEGTRDIPRGLIDSVWTRRHSAGRGAAIGGLIGGLLIGAAAVELDAGFGGEQLGLAAITGFAVGGLGGLTLGAVVGAVVPHWHRRAP